MQQPYFNVNSNEPKAVKGRALLWRRRSCLRRGPFSSSAGFGACRLNLGSSDSGFGSGGMVRLRVLGLRYEG